MSLPVSTAQADGVAWQAKFDKALEAAATKQQPVLIFATIEGCFFCQKMYHEAFADKRIADELNRDFVPVKLDADQSRDVLDRMGVEAYPTTLIFSHQGKLLKRLEGYKPTARLQRAMKSAREHRVAAKQ
ncbi:MAG: DUF255 domain-containing protein [Pirellulales bacterium]|nr:DUF255 domain-containing protein [Pirellulales bacterium]